MHMYHLIPETAEAAGRLAIFLKLAVMVSAIRSTTNIVVTHASSALKARSAVTISPRSHTAQATAVLCVLAAACN